MIAIINDGKNLYGAIVYNYEKVKNGEGTILETNRIILNINPKVDLHVKLAMESFEHYMIANLRTSKPVTHISLNPDPRDLLSDEEYILLAQDYLQQMNFGDQPYIIYKHTDIDRTHLHIVTTRIGEEGNKQVSDSFEKIRNKKVCRELEIKYNLTPITNKQKSEKTDLPLKVNYKKSDIKHQISNTLKTVVEKYKFQTFGEYNALLQCYNIHAKQVKGEESDNPYKGIIYSAMNEKGEIVGLPIKSSLISKTVGHDFLERKMLNDKEKMKQLKTKMPPQRIIANAMKLTSTPETFKKILAKYNMEVILRSNEAGRIYGVTFIDHYNKIVFNGSRLGKEFSANVFHAKFNRPSVEVNPKISVKDNLSISDSPFDMLFENNPIEFHGENLEYEFQRRIKKKKRKGRSI